VDRDEVVAELVSAALISADGTALDLTEAVAWRFIDLVRSGDSQGLTPIIKAIERLLAEGGDEAIDVVGAGLLEDVGNIVSHPTEGIGEAHVFGLLGPRARIVWRCIDAFFTAVELRLPELEEATNSEAKERVKRLTPEDAARAESEDLRRFIAKTYRQSGGQLIGTDDLLRYELLVGNWLTAVITVAFSPLRMRED